MSRPFSSGVEAAQTANERWQARIRAHRLKMSLMKINQLIQEMRDCYGSEHNKKENV
jgi:hypothetical protein